VVHDVGKIGVPEHVLLKKGPLTEEDWAIMKQHPVTGERICSPLRSFRHVLPIIRHHHEKLDGTGYPDGLKGDEIPLTARVLQVTDIYDALVTDRPYRAALPHDAAIEILQNEAARGWWERHLIDEFEGLLTEQNPMVKTIEVVHAF
jgi:putative two-component system response regulator